MAVNNALRRRNAEDTTSLIPGLPDEIGMACLARVPLHHRHILSGVCRKWRAMFHETYFWEVRRELSVSETALLLWACIPYRGTKCHGSYPEWHGFYPSSNKWFRLPTMPADDRVKGTSTFAVVDEKLFVIGGMRSRCTEGDPNVSVAVSYFDMKLYRWDITAPMKVARAHCTAGVINDKLYVCGGITNQNVVTNTVEVYDPRTQTWTLVSEMGSPRDSPVKPVLRSIVLDRKLYVLFTPTRKFDLDLGPKARLRWQFEGAVYDPEMGSWMAMPNELSSFGLCGRAVEFEGKICVMRDSCTCQRSEVPSIWTYNSSQDSWELIHGEAVKEANSFLHLKYHRWQRNMGREQLVSIDQCLYTLSKSKGTRGAELRFEIKSLSRKIVASKSFHPPLSDAQALRRSRELEEFDTDDEVDYQFVKL